MREGPHRTARVVVAGARAIIRREPRAFRTSGPGHPTVGDRTRVLPGYESRSMLRAEARRQAHLARGRTRFVWESRVVAFGIPLGIAAGVAAWRTGSGGRARDFGRFAGALAATVALAYLEAAAEWRGMEEADGV